MDVERLSMVCVTSHVVNCVNFYTNKLINTLVNLVTIVGLYSNITVNLLYPLGLCGANLLSQLLSCDHTMTTAQYHM